MKHPVPLSDSFHRRDVAGIPFVATSRAQVVEMVLGMGEARQAQPVRLVNAYSIALSVTDESYREVLEGEGLNLPDGAPVAWALRCRAHGCEAERVRGPAFFEQTLASSQERGTRHFLLGSTPETLARLADSLTARYTRLQIAGMFAPPFGPVSDELVRSCAVRINASDADVVWVGLGTPKQDFVARRLAAMVERPCIAVGAAFDFSSGIKKTAPMWVQRLWLEWLFRLLSEPRRLWRRYLIGNFIFLYAMVRGSRPKSLAVRT